MIDALNPDTMPKSLGYSQVMVTSGSKTVYIAGQVALDREGQLVGAGDLEAQARQCFLNLAAALEAAGASFDHVVKFGFFLTDISQIAKVRAIRDQFINTAKPPTSTAVEVSRLFRDGLLIEVEAIAVLP
jgi:reactive intermediate/imine deaminase